LKVVLLILVMLVIAPTAQAHLPYKPKNDSTKARLTAQTKNLAHARYVCKNGAGAHKRWACSAQHWLNKERNKTVAKLTVVSTNYWIAKQIRVATLIGNAAEVDPWPNCSDPIWDGAKNWQVTVNCENLGNWMDSPGFYRCGLQFHPNWERKYGRLCP
jgi:hypothetical protein